MEWKELQAALAKQNYIASNELVVAIQLALSLERPLLLEGSAGVGKTELARALSSLVEAIDTGAITKQVLPSSGHTRVAAGLVFSCV